MNVLLHVPYHAKKAVVVIVDVNIIAGLDTGASTNSCNNMEGFIATTLRPHHRHSHRGSLHLYCSITGATINISRHVIAEHRHALRGVARKGLPSIIRDNIGTSFTDWQDFTTKVREVPIVEITDYVEKRKRDEERQAKTEREIAELRSALARQAQESPRTALSNQLARTNFSAPTSPSPAPRRFGRLGPDLGNAPPANIQWGIPEATAQQNAWLRSHIDDYPKKANDEAGLAVYEEQRRDWGIHHPGGWVDYATPYPIHPSTALTCTGECFGCGMNGHSVRDCPILAEDTSPAIDPKEKIWRQLCYKALGAYRRDTVEEVRLVELGGEVEDQGNGEGLRV
ncbi:hypothetical protein ARMSODRAFT_1028160 [Armillaria solidipes]|uniref:CCHC-type domain-containing protein n=1 Tax=Armillaria solidipes TaxID=1076256 RepID=A0A2H3B1S5_9AGAR|nr:hypothetical protein ARMSODRAFT_1028160 [Armillaria solidipes]